MTRPDNTTSLPGFTLLDTCQKALPPIPATISGLLHHGHTICAGPPKLGKSYLALQLCYAVASGEAALGALAVKRRGKVLYLALEDGERRLKARTDALLLGTQPEWLADIHVVYELPHPLDTKEGMEWLERMLSANQYELLVIDTYVKAFPSANASRDLLKSEYREMDKLTKLSGKYDLAILTIAHTRKPGRDEDGSSLVSVAGTTGRTAAADAILMLSGKPGKGKAKLNVTSRDTEGLELDLTRAGDTGAWIATPPDGQSAGPRLSPGQNLVLDLLKRKGPLKRCDIEKELPDQKPQSIGTWLHRLEKNGQVEVTGLSLSTYCLPGQPVVSKPN